MLSILLILAVCRMRVTCKTIDDPGHRRGADSEGLGSTRGDLRFRASLVRLGTSSSQDGNAKEKFD